MTGIIKAGMPTAERSGVAAVAFNFDDMTGKAQAYLKQVRAEAADILAKAQQEAAQVRKQAQEQGIRTAQETAEKSLEARVARQVAEQMESVLPAVEHIVELLSAARHEWLKKWEENAVQLSLAIAEKVIRQELTQRPDITVGLVREALELAAGSQSIKVLLHPQDFAAIGEQVQELARRLSRLSPATIQPDTAVERGGCLVQTEFGQIDQRIASQLARIEEELV